MANITPTAYVGGTLTVGAAVVGVRDASYSVTTALGDHTHIGSSGFREKHITWKEDKFSFDVIANGSEAATLLGYAGTVQNVTWSPAGLSAKKMAVTSVTISGSLDDNMITLDIELEGVGETA